jgi:GNAT superfamily N-acetyltransferase
MPTRNGGRSEAQAIRQETPVASVDSLSPEARGDKAVSDVQALGTLNPDISVADFGEHYNFKTADGSMATFAVSRNAYDNSLYLRTIESVTGKGAGTAFMKKFVEMADKNNVVASLNVEPFSRDRNIYATKEARQKANEAIKKNLEEAKARGELPKPIKVDFSGGVKTYSKPSMEKIIAFYESFGFKHDPKSQVRGDYVMTRQPNA